jgi:hypothetical protein
MQRRILLSGAVALAGAAVLPGTAQAQSANGLVVQDAVGVARTLAGTAYNRRFQGQIRITEMAYDGQLRVSGFISGVAQGAGAKVNVINQEFEQVAATLVEPPASGGTTAVAQQVCPILDLDIGPIFLNLLGLVIDLSAIHLDITAVSEAGALLGNLLCALVGLLDGIALGDLLEQILGEILELIEQINDILAGNLITL